MSRGKRVKMDDRDAFYHVMSRVTGEQYLLRSADVKEAMLDALRRSAAFSGVDVAGFCIMDTHFHVLIRVPKRDAGTLPDEEVLRRAGLLCGERGFARLRDELDALGAAGDVDGIKRKFDRYRARMHDMSEFMKTFLETFGTRFRRIRPYAGRLWGDRFKSVLIEDAKQLLRCKRYIELNPVRAGMVNRVCAYAWSTEGAASRGDEFAKACLAWLPSQLAGDAPVEEWMTRRCAQMTSGKILGGKAYVGAMIALHAGCFRSKSLCARQVADGLYASHGYRLAKKDAASRAA